jgi:hypothetical protein
MPWFPVTAHDFVKSMFHETLPRTYYWMLTFLTLPLLIRENIMIESFAQLFSIHVLASSNHH